VHLVERLKERGYALLDCQIQNDHLASLVALEIPERGLRMALKPRRGFV
jgi:leucyl/phenylalanyl-tRNA--protein transferase